MDSLSDNIIILVILVSVTKVNSVTEQSQVTMEQHSAISVLLMSWSSGLNYMGLDPPMCHEPNPIQALY